MTYLLGLDGGGSKTDVALCDERGNVLARAIGGAGSLTGQEEAAAFAHISQAIEQATACIGGASAMNGAFFGGISGGGLEVNREKFRALFERLLPNASARRNGSDSVNALSAGLGQGDGLIAIAGTGSSVFARVKGEMRQVGGWGYLLGDEGSGFDLGRRALMAALKNLDGRGGETCLKPMIEAQAGCTLRELITRLYAQDSKKMIASYAPLLLEAAQAQDQTALDALDEATGELAFAILHAAQLCGRRRLVMGGSIWKNSLYRQMVAQKLGDDFEMIAPDLPPVYGSIVEAAALVGLPADEQFTENFRKTLIKE